MKKISFYGEGRRDVSEPDGIDKPSVLKEYVDNIVCNISGENVSFHSKGTHIRRLQVPGFKRKVKAAMVDARREGYDAVVFVVDCSQKFSNKRLRELQEGREMALRDHIIIPVAIGLSVYEIEAWLLGDDKARRKHLGKKGGDALPEDIEKIEKIKKTFDNLYSQLKQDLHDEPIPKWQVALNLAKDSNIDNLKKRLIHFNQFYEDVREQLIPLFRE